MTTNWTIEKLECKIQENNLNNVVYRVHWRYTKTMDINNKTYSMSNYDVINVPAADPADFTPYESLTKEQVLSWVQTILGQEYITTMDSRLEAAIISQTERVALDPPFTN